MVTNYGIIRDIEKEIEKEDNTLSIQMISILN